MSRHCNCGVTSMSVHGETNGRDAGENIFLPRKAEILRAVQATASEKHFTLRMADGKPMEFQPGQFLEVSLFGYGEIPIGLASSPTRKNTFDIVVRGVGRVSQAVCRLNQGDALYLRGPLGSGFDLAKLRGSDVLVVAGGVGLCPTRSLIQYILDRRAEFKRFLLFYGAREPKQQLFPEDLEKWRVSKEVEYHETVDRGDPSWKGNVGVITTLFQKTQVGPGMKVVVCGPPIMFKFVIAQLGKLGIPDKDIFLDFERRMKCGVGKCGHCQMNDKYVCTDGPVFTYADLKNLAEAF